MTDSRIDIQRQDMVVIGYLVTHDQSEYYRSNGGHWHISGTGTSSPFGDRKTALTTFHKALKRGSCSAAMRAVVIPERLWP